MIHFVKLSSRNMYRSSNHRARRALTLIELLVSITISLMLVSSVVASFTTLIRAFEKSEILVDVGSNLRMALDTLTREIKQVNTPVIFPGQFIGLDQPLTFGDGRDNDQDGLIDEETPNGLNDDGGALDDRHALVAGFSERPQGVAVVDFGDGNVDEDNLFHLDRLSFRITQNPAVDFLYQDIVYEVTTFDSVEHVLVRTVRTTSVGNVVSADVSSPVAYNVLSFNCLYWNPNIASSSQGWLESWDSSAPPGSGSFDVPASVLVTLTVYADRTPIESYVGGTEVDTISLSTVINIEDVIQDAAFPRN